MTDYLETERIAFWLLPANEDHVRLGTIIENLSCRFKTPVFDPHVTLLVTPTNAMPDPAAMLNNFCKKSQPLTLEFSRTPEWSPVYNRALVLPVSTTDELVKTVVALSQQGQAPPSFSPHISLLYGHLDETTGKNVAREILLNETKALFDRVAAIRIGPKTSSAEDIKHWAVIATGELGQKED